MGQLFGWLWSPKTLFSPKMGAVFKSDLGAIQDVQSINNGPLSKPTKFQLDGEKMA